MKSKIVYIDDNPQELEKYKAKFASDNRASENFHLYTFSAPELKGDFNRINEIMPDIFLVDYNFDIPDADNNVIGVTGITLGIQLRQVYPEVPIVLFTRKSVFNPKKAYQLKETLSAFDEIVYKQDLFQADSALLEKLTVLAKDYRTLRNQESKSWTSLLKLIQSPPNDTLLLEQVNRPDVSRHNWSANTIAKWLRNTILKFPGIVYDSIHAATFLGISREAFLSDEFQATFSKAKYSGLFAPSEGRWWRSQLQRIAYSIMSKKEKDLPLGIGFTSAWGRKSEKPIEKAKCIYSGEEPADWVCEILNQPVMLKYTLAYNTDQRPSIMDESRVSFKAIRTSNEFDPKNLDPLGKELISTIRSMADLTEGTNAE